MRIRDYKPSDAESIVRMHSFTIRKVNSKDYPREQIRVWIKQLNVRKLRSPKNNKKSFVAIEKSKVVGFGVLNKQEITGLYVHPHYHGKGIGTKLLFAMEKYVRQHGARSLKCKSTITAKTFYVRHGFKTIMRTVYPIDNHRLTVFLMRKSLK
jgi:putative acetyltransferase